MFIVTDIAAIAGYLRGEIPLKGLLCSLLLPLILLLFWFGQFVVAFVMYVVMLIWYSPLLIFGYIADWIHRRKKKGP